MSRKNILHVIRSSMYLGLISWLFISSISIFGQSNNNIWPKYHKYKRCTVVDTMFFNSLDSVYSLTNLKNTKYRSVEFFKRLGIVRSYEYQPNPLDTFYCPIFSGEIHFNESNKNKYPLAIIIDGLNYMVYHNFECIVYYKGKHYVFNDIAITLGLIKFKRNVSIKMQWEGLDDIIQLTHRTVLVSENKRLLLLPNKYFQKGYRYFFMGDSTLNPSSVIVEE